jgi:hypothetical protein
VGVTITGGVGGQAGTAITITVSPVSLSVGQSASFSGVLTRTDTGAPLSAHNVLVETSADGGATWITVATLVTNFPDGSFSGTLMFTSAGNYLARSNFPGGSDGVTTFGPSTSAPISIVVGGGGGGTINTATTFSASPTSITAGQNLSFSGTLKRTDTGAGLSGQTIVIESSSDNGATFSTVMTVTTGSLGSYSGAGSFTAAGTYLMRGRFAGA